MIRGNPGADVPVVGYTGWIQALVRLRSRLFQSSWLCSRNAFTVVSLATMAPGFGQTPDPKLYSEMHWRQIGPPRAGRARALSGVPSQPNVFYIGFDNGGVWRSTDFGSTWIPLFDRETTGSIGAITVAPSDPNIIYIG